MEKEKILVVDDEPAIRALVEHVAAGSGFKADSASDTSGAMEAMSKADYPLVICDIRMPGNNGIWLLKEIKKSYPDTQVVMLTASDNLEDAIESLNLGAEGYMLKPPSIDEISHSIEKAIELHRLVIRDRQHKKWMAQKLEEQKARIKDLFVGSMKALATSLEAKDKYTKGHSDMVTELSTSLVKFIRMEEELLGKIEAAASLHDIGKIGTRDAVLNKPGKLTGEEYEHVKKHAAMGERIVKPLIDDKDVTDGVRHHHERFDGKGYPDGLVDSQIPRTARIIALADAFDAMTSDRPYRKGYSREEAIGRIKQDAGKQFDPELVEKFLEMMEKG